MLGPRRTTGWYVLLNGEVVVVDPLYRDCEVRIGPGRCVDVLSFSTQPSSQLVDLWGLPEQSHLRPPSVPHPPHRPHLRPVPQDRTNRHPWSAPPHRQQGHSRPCSCSCPSSRASRRHRSCRRGHDTVHDATSRLRRIYSAAHGSASSSSPTYRL